MEPLQRLRDCVVERKHVELAGDRINLDGTSYPRSAPTAFRSKTGYYTLETLLFVWQLRDSQWDAYLAACKSAGVQQVRSLDRPKIEGWLATKSATSELVDASYNPTIESYPVEKSADDLSVPAKRQKVAARDSAGAAARFVVTAEDLALVKAREVRYHTRSTILEKQVLELDGNKAMSAAPEQKDKRPKFIGTPVIVVPSSPSATITMYNAEDFFAHSKYITTSEAKRIFRERGQSKPSRITITRTDMRGVSCRFHIMDDVSRFQKGDWYKIAAVVVDGPEWQFRGWGRTNPKFDSPVKIFDRVLGLFIGFEDQDAPATVTQWNVQSLHLNQSRRFRDAVVVGKVWETVDSYIDTRVPYLQQPAQA